MRKLMPLVLVAVGAIALFAWTVIDRDRADATGGDSPLAFVHADTAYLFTVAEPLPDAISQTWLRQTDPLLPMYADQLRRAATALRGDAEVPAQVPALLEALALELQGKRMVEVLAAAGFSPTPRMALYGLGLVPVLRMELADPQAFRAFVTRMETAAGEPLATAEVGGQPYWRWPLPGVRLELVGAVMGDQLVVAPAPAAASPEALQALFGLAAPDPALPGSGTLEALQERFDYLPGMLGYVDSGRVLAALTGEPSSLERAFLAALDIQKPAPDPVCADEYRALATLWPRLSMGYTVLEADRMQAKVVFEAAARISQDLMALRAPMPALAASDGSLANVGFSLDVEAVPRLVSKHAGAIGEAPYACPQLAVLNTGAVQARDGGAQQALYTAAPVFRGVHVVLEDLVLGAGMQVQSLRGAVVVGSPNPRTLLSLAASVLPQAGQLQLQPDGSVVPLELPALPGAPALPGFVAMTDTLLAIGVGDGMDARLPDYLESNDRQQPLLVFGYSGRLYQMLADIIDQGAAVVADPDSRAEMEQQARMMREFYGNWIERAELRVDFTDNGIELLQDVHTNPPR